MHGCASLCLSASASGLGRWPGELINYWTKCVPYAAATVWRIVVCTFGRFTAGHIQAHACVPIEYYDLKWHGFVFYAPRRPAGCGTNIYA